MTTCARIDEFFSEYVVVSVLWLCVCTRYTYLSIGFKKDERNIVRTAQKAHTKTERVSELVSEWVCVCVRLTSNTNRYARTLVVRFTTRSNWFSTLTHAYINNRASVENRQTGNLIAANCVRFVARAFVLRCDNDFSNYMHTTQHWMSLEINCKQYELINLPLYFG